MSTIFVFLGMALLVAAAVYTFSLKKELDGNKPHLTAEEFRQLLFDYKSNPEEYVYKNTLPAIVDFYASWCEPCKALGPVLDEVAQEYDGRLQVYRVNVEWDAELPAVFGIRSVPTLLLFAADGTPPRIYQGAPNKLQLKQMVEEMVGE